jgi:hypothetical protein
VVDVVQRLPVAPVEKIVTPRHEGEQVLGPIAGFGVDGHRCFISGLVV